MDIKFKCAYCNKESFKRAANQVYCSFETFKGSCAAKGAKLKMKKCKTEKKYKYEKNTNLYMGHLNQ